MLTNHSRRNSAAATALGALSFIGSCSLDANITLGQDRVLAAFAELTSRFSPKIAAPTPTLKSTFERTVTEAPGLAEDLRAALNDSTLLKIVSGQLVPTTPRNAWEVQLTDGSHLSFHIANKPEFGVTKSGYVTICEEANVYAIPVAAICAIRPQRDLRYDPAWSERMAEQSTSDTIFIRQKYGVLDHLEGVALKFTKTHLEFEYDGDVLPIPYAKIEGVRMASRQSLQDASLHIPAATLQTERHTIKYSELRVSEELSPKIQIETPAGATLSAALTPFIIDRTGTLALTAHDLTIHSRRLPIEDWQMMSQSPIHWPLAAPPTVHVITGRGLQTELTIKGPAELEIDLPKGYSHLHFELEISGIPVAPVTFRYQQKGEESQVILYQQPRFPEPEQLLDLKNELHFPAAGKLLLHVPGEARFRTFLLSKE